MTAPEPVQAGLAGVVAGTTSICSLGDGLRYRGYAIGPLAGSSSYEEVAYLLIHGELPDVDQLTACRSRIAEAAAGLDPSVCRSLSILAEREPAASVMAALRTGVSMLGQVERDASPLQQGRLDAAELQRHAERLIGATAGLLAFWIDRVSDRLGATAEPAWPHGSLAEALLTRLTGRQPSPEHIRAFDTTLTLYAEHEFNASTFTARTVASTGGGMHAAVTAAIGALEGPLHGGANEMVLADLAEIGDASRARGWVEERLASKRVVMGFGHRVYKHGDERAKLLGPICRELSGDGGLEPIAAEVEAIMLERKGLLPNLDWPAARIYHALGLPVQVFTPIFVVARMAGWTAHVIEQMQGNRLIRPLSRYVGPGPRDYLPLEARTTVHGLES
jgi:2-methylcitrate synthase